MTGARSKRRPRRRWTMTLGTTVRMLAPSEADREEYEALADELAETYGATEGFWLFTEGVPDDLRRLPPDVPIGEPGWQAAVTANRAHRIRRLHFLENNGYHEHARVERDAIEEVLS